MKDKTKKKPFGYYEIGETLSIMIIPGEWTVCKVVQSSPTCKCKDCIMYPFHDDACIGVACNKWQRPDGKEVVLVEVKEDGGRMTAKRHGLKIVEVDT